MKFNFKEGLKGGFWVPLGFIFGFILMSFIVWDMEFFFFMITDKVMMRAVIIIFLIAFSFGGLENAKDGKFILSFNRFDNKTSRWIAVRKFILVEKKDEQKD